MNTFSRQLIPALKKRIPPTYSIWAANNFEKSCLSDAIRKSAEVARTFEALLADSGDVFDSSGEEDDDEDELIWSDDDIEDEVHNILPSSDDFLGEEPDEVDKELGWLLDSSQESADTSRAKRLKRNVLFEMMDDLPLRTWCEMAKDKEKDLEQVGDDVPGGLAMFTDVPISPWPVHKPFTAADAASLKSMAKKSQKVKLRAGVGLVIHVHNSDSGSSDDAEHAPYSDDSTSSAVTSPTTFRNSSTYFYPEDPIGENLVPFRLPNSLLNPSSSSTMEKMRLHAIVALNQVAGLQLKIKHLREFVEEQMNGREAMHESDYGIKDEKKRARTPSPLSQVLATSTPPSPPPIPKLRKRKSSFSLPGVSALRVATADIALGRSAESALADVRKSQGNPAKSGVKRRRPSSPEDDDTRVLKRSNLRTIEAVRSLTVASPPCNTSPPSPARAPLGGVVPAVRSTPALSTSLQAQTSPVSSKKPGQVSYLRPLKSHSSSLSLLDDPFIDNPPASNLPITRLDNAALANCRANTLVAQSGEALTAHGREKILEILNELDPDGEEQDSLLGELWGLDDGVKERQLGLMDVVPEDIVVQSGVSNSVCDNSQFFPVFTASNEDLRTPSSFPKSFTGASAHPPKLHIPATPASFPTSSERHELEIFPTELPHAPIPVRPGLASFDETEKDDSMEDMI
ncbi:hypothetical protein T439DRAFT_320390 [Meredithblackwellia eburnea MCA 4105]